MCSVQSVGNKRRAVQPHIQVHTALACQLLHPCSQTVTSLLPCRAALSGLAALPALLAAAPALALGKDVKKAMQE